MTDLEGTKEGSLAGGHGDNAEAELLRDSVAVPQEPILSERSVGGSSGVAIERMRSGEAVARRVGARAELASLRARLRLARGKGDLETERLTAARLSRQLAREGRCLAEATKLARRALLLGEDPSLREALSGWFAGIGEFHLAAGTLKPLLDRYERGPARAAVSMRVAVLLARADDPAGAAGALALAAEVDRSDPLPLELFGALRLWAPDALSQRRAATAYQEAAARRRSRGELRGATDALIRGFEAAPSAAGIVERLATELQQEGRAQAADEIWREAAGHSSEPSAIHARRIREALGYGDVATALAAALDQGADTVLDVESVSTAAGLASEGAGSVPVPNFDGLLAPAGLTELLAARLEMVAEGRRGEERCVLLLSLARLVGGPLGDPARAARFLGEALVACPENDEAARALHDYALGTGDVEVEAETLLRVGMQEGFGAGKQRSLEALALLAEQQLEDPGRGLWALEKLEQSLGQLPGELLRLRQRLEATERAECKPKQEWQTVSLGELRRALEALAHRPEHGGEYADALTEMCRRDPKAVRWRRSLQRVLARLDDSARLEAFWAEELDAGGERAALARVELCRSYRHVQPERALSLLDGLSEPSVQEATAFSTLASLKGSERQRALSLEQLAHCCRSGVKASLLGVSSGLLLAGGERSEARRVAERACHSGPTLARPIVAYADSAEADGSRVSVLALQRACEVTVTRSRWCRALAETHPDPAQSMAWLRRWASLSPLDLEVASYLLSRLVSTAAVGELTKGLDWLLGQPLPMDRLTRPLTAALRLLTADAPQAARALCQRLLGVLGVTNDEIRKALEEAADVLGEPVLRVALIERSCAAHNRDSASECVKLAELRFQMAQTDLAYDACERALRSGAEAAEVAELLGKLPAPTNSDGELCRQRAWVALSRKDSSPKTLAMKLRELGAALWDLAADGDGALASWIEAAQLCGADGDLGLARDLIAFAGYERALGHLTEIAAKREPAEGARLLRLGAQVALNDGFPEQALELALQALRRHPSGAEALGLIEEAAGPEQAEVLQEAYSLADGALLGCYGERALHYRAAREFERRHDSERALEHALTAFRAVEAEGVVFDMLVRQASLRSEERRLASLLEETAQRAKDPQVAARWLSHAATVVGATTEGRAERASVLLRALSIGANTQAIDALREALSGLVGQHSESRTLLLEQFREVAREVLRRLQGEEGAPVAVALGGLAIESFNDGGLGAQALLRALQLHPETGVVVGEGWRAALTISPAATRLLLNELLLAIERGRSPAGSLLQLGAELAGQMSPELEPALVVELARVHPEDLEVIARAEAMVVARPELGARLREAVELPDQAADILERARRLRRSSPPQAATLYTSLVGRDGAPLELQRSALDELQSCFAGQSEGLSRLERVMLGLLEKPTLPPRLRGEVARRGAALLRERGAFKAALDVFELAARQVNLGPEELAEAADLARLAGAPELELGFLQNLAREAPDGPDESVLRRLVSLHESEGQRRDAVEWAWMLLRLQPSDSAMVSLILLHAEQSEDWIAMARLLEHRLEQSAHPSDSEILQLADTYARRLEEPRRAAELLERLQGERPPSQVLLERLAECFMACGERTRAAKTFQRAARAAKEPRVAARFAEIATKTYLDAGELSGAAAVLASKSIFPQTEPLARLRVEVAVRQGQAGAEADALEELAYISMSPPHERARLLRRAAELSLADGRSEQALARAQRAARIAPTDPETQIYARTLEYRTREAGTPDEALTTISELRSLGRLADPSLVALRAFLLAEALDRRVGPGAGLKEIQTAQAVVGLKPLIALAYLERWRQGDSTRHIGEWLRCVQGGDFHGLRTSAQVMETVRRCSEASSQTLMPPEPVASPAELKLPRAMSIRPRDGKPSSDGVATAEVKAVGGPQRATDGKTAEASGGAPQRLRQAPPPKPKVATGAEERKASDVPTAEDSPPALGPANAAPDSGAQPEGQDAPQEESAGVVQTQVQSIGAVAPGIDAEPGKVDAPASSTGEQPAFAELAQGAPESQALASEGQAPALDDGVETAQLAGDLVKKSQEPQREDAALASTTTRGVDGAFAISDSPEELGVGPTGSVPVSEEASDWIRRRSPSDRDLDRESTDALPRESGSGPHPSLEAALRQTVEPPEFQVGGPGLVDVDERRLRASLRAGSLRAGRELADKLAGVPRRSQELVSLCQQMAELNPGDIGVLRQLRNAAEGDRNPLFARSLEQVLWALGDTEQEQEAAPPLRALNVEPLVLSRLLVGGREPIIEAMTLVLAGAPHLFRSPGREPGVAAAPVELRDFGSELVVCSRLFSVPRVPLDWCEVDRDERMLPEICVSVELGPPMGLCAAAAEVTTATEFAFDLGGALVCCRPELALVAGVSAARFSVVLDGVLAAFGPPRRLKGDISQVAHLAENLWESLPARSQRRLQELCEDPAVVSLPRAQAAMRRAVARAGLFACGDIGVALSRARQLDRLRALSQEGEEGCWEAEVLTFATSSEYAEARWRSGVP